MKEIVLRILTFVLFFIISQIIVLPSSGASFDVDSGYIEMDDGRIFYEAAGSGPAVIMIHDGILHHETWDGQFA